MAGCNMRHSPGHGKLSSGGLMPYGLLNLGLDPWRSRADSNHRFKIRSQVPYPLDYESMIC